MKSSHMLFATALMFAAFSVQANNNTEPLTSKEGYPCLYSKHIRQDLSQCVIGYFDKNGLLIKNDGSLNVADVAYYRVLLDKNKYGQHVIQSFFPNGQKKTSAIVINARGDLLSKTTMSSLQADFFRDSCTHLLEQGGVPCRSLPYSTRKNRRPYCHMAMRSLFGKK